MNIKIDKKTLVDLLVVTQSIAEKKTTMPILANLLLEVEEDFLRITSSDLEITVISQRPVELIQAGRTTISAKLFSEVVREMPEGQISLTLFEGSRLEVRSGKTVVKIFGQSADEYPVLKNLDLRADAKLPVKTLEEMIRKTVYAASQDEAKFYLAGVFFETAVLENQKILRLVATDGFRLAEITRTIPDTFFALYNKTAKRASAIVPKKALTEAKKALEQDINGLVGLDLTENYLVIDTGFTRFIIQLIDGEYPDVSQVMPEIDSKRFISIPAGILLDTVRRASLMVSEKAKPIKLVLEGDQITLSSASPELGDVKEQLLVESTGFEYTSGFNARYLQEAISSFSRDELIKIYLNEAGGPAILTAENDQSYKTVLMPIRV